MTDETNHAAFVVAVFELARDRDTAELERMRKRAMEAQHVADIAAVLLQARKVRAAQAVVDALSRYATFFPAPVEPPAARHAGYLSPNVPHGYQTILGYLATYQPEVLDVLDCSYPETTQRDGYKLAHWCRQEGLEPVYVEAPPVMAANGIVHVRAYPLAMLERRFS